MQDMFVQVSVKIHKSPVRTFIPHKLCVCGVKNGECNRLARLVKASASK